MLCCKLCLILCVFGSREVVDDIVDQVDNIVQGEGENVLSV